MFNNPYVSSFNPQMTADRIDSQIAELQKIKSQIPQAPAINQTFQLAPSSQSGMRFVNSIDEVNKEIVNSDTPYFSKDLSVLWIKNSKGEVRAYELKEIVQKDEKDLIIESLQAQIIEMKKEMKENAKSSVNYDDEPIESEKPTDVSNGRTSKKK